MASIEHSAATISFECGAASSVIERGGTLAAMFGRPPRRQLGPRYDFWASVVAFAVATVLVIAVIRWSLAIVP